MVYCARAGECNGPLGIAKLLQTIGKQLILLYDIILKTIKPSDYKHQLPIVQA